MLFKETENTNDAQNGSHPMLGKYFHHSKGIPDKRFHPVKT